MEVGMVFLTSMPSNTLMDHGERGSNSAISWSGASMMEGSLATIGRVLARAQGKVIKLGFDPWAGFQPWKEIFQQPAGGHGPAFFQRMMRPGDLIWGSALFG
jgi:hypothetical protein